MIGRKEEAKKLNRLYNSKKAEFIAVYGRRRVGKTYLINEVFGERITFYHAGLSPVDDENPSPMKAQLAQFYYSLQSQGMKGRKKPTDWIEAFFMLEMFLQEKDDGSSRQLVFIDELPWMDTPKSGFITALEGFWNGWACRRKNFMLIVCGSASSWILDKLINNHGGLYGRVTYEICLKPFNLAECEELLHSSGVRLSRYDIVGAYMAVGGIPFYLGYFQEGLSLAQSLDKMFFEKEAILKNEFERLFESAFADSDTTKAIVCFLSRKRSGYTRSELASGLHMKEGGTMSKNISSLIASGFVEKYIPFGRKKNEYYYKLIDPFCLFYLYFVEGKKTSSQNYWQKHLESQSVVSWRGFAFENVCFNHISQIKQALGISGVTTEESAWTERGNDQDGAQIDLIIEREDNLVNACEIKYYSKPFSVDKKHYQTLLNRPDLMRQYLSPKQSVIQTLITTYGLNYNEYSGVFSSVVTLDDLFK